MKIVIAPQAFKSCASAQIVASTIAAGIHRAFPHAHLVLVPIADGGDDTLEILLAAKSGSRQLSEVSDAQNKKKLVHWGALNNAFPKTAIIESARICGLASLPENNRNPMITTTYGIGELINIALDKGYRRIFVGLGGSSTNDAGAGLAQALGVRFLDNYGNQLPPGGGALVHLHSIDTSLINPLIKEAEIIAGCDVNNPLLGQNGASCIFSPQKGASKTMVNLLEKSLENFSMIIKNKYGKDISQIPYMGAAGGTATSLSLFCHAKLVSGAQWILNEICFDQILENVDLVITGEGCFDSQTAFQKAPLIVAQTSKKHKVPVIAIVGTIGPSTEILNRKEFDAIFPVSLNSKEIPPNALQLLQKTSEKAITEFFAK